MPPHPHPPAQPFQDEEFELPTSVELDDASVSGILVTDVTTFAELNANGLIDVRVHSEQVRLPPGEERRSNIPDHTAQPYQEPMNTCPFSDVGPSSALCTNPQALDMILDDDINDEDLFGGGPPPPSPVDQDSEILAEAENFLCEPPELITSDLDSDDDDI